MIIIRSRHPSHRPLRKAKVKSNYKKVVYRLGSTTSGKFDGEINSIESIKNSASKLRMKSCFSKAKVKTARYWLKPSDIPQDAYPIIAKIVYGSRGRGMVKIDTPEDMTKFLNGPYKKRGNNNGGYYFEEYFNGSREYRIHYAVGIGAFYCLRKLRKNEAKERWFFNNENCNWINQYQVIRDSKNRFVRFTNTIQEQFAMPSNWDVIIKEVEKAVKAVGLDIAAVDVRVKKDGDFIIVETNSAPGLAEIGTKVYIETLTKLGKKFK